MVVHFDGMRAGAVTARVDAPQGQASRGAMPPPAPAVGTESAVPTAQAIKNCGEGSAVGCWKDGAVPSSGGRNAIWQVIEA